MRKIGIDYGDRKIGLAISDELCILASPLPTLKVNSLADAITKIQRIIKTQNITTVVIGLPLTRLGTETQQSIQTRYFANALKSTNGAKVEFWNELFTTQKAESFSKYSTKRYKKNIDSEVARTILQEYLDAQKQPKINQFINPYISPYNKSLNSI